MKTLAKYRKFNEEVVFGQNLIPLSSGKLEVGMKVEVLNYTNNHLNFFIEADDLKIFLTC